MRQSQIETLAIVANHPDGVWASDIAHRTNRSIRAAEQRLERLTEVGLLRRDHMEWDGVNSRELHSCIFAWRLTDAGREVLRERGTNNA